VDQLVEPVLALKVPLLIQARQNGFDVAWERLPEDLLVGGANAVTHGTKKLRVRLRSCMVFVTRAAPHVRSPVLLTVGKTLEHES
jgi:hypothetical protein